MTYLVKCINHECVLKSKCYRYKAKIVSVKQSTGYFFCNDDGDCDHFIVLHDRKDSK